MPILTTKAVERLQPASTRREVADGLVGGLFVIVQTSGVKSWALRYRFQGQTRKLTLGAVLLDRKNNALPAIGAPMTLAEARKAARQALQDVAEGSDPAKVKKTDKAVARSGEDRLDFQADRFIERYCKPRLKAWKQVERQFRVEILPKWGSRRVQDIKRRDIIVLLDEIVARGAPVTANRVLSTVSRFFNWLLERDVIKTSPVAGVRMPSPETARDRILSDDEVAAVWNETKTPGHFNWIVRLLLLTGQRRSEVANMVWGELDLDKAVWTLPPPRTKNSVLHTVPLSAPAVDLLSAVPAVVGQELLFTTNGERGFSGYSKAKDKLDDVIQLEQPWTIHDLRRTVASGMARLGIHLPVVERVLNHTGTSFKGVAGIYQRHDFAAEKRHALDLWARHVMRIAERAEAKIVAFPGRSA